MSIDLGHKMEPLNGPPAEISSERMYPAFHYCGPKELDLPDSGEMTVKFRKKSETSTRRDDGSHWYECCIEVQSIEEVDSEEPEAPSKSYDEAGEALDALAEAISKRKEKE